METHATAQRSQLLERESIFATHYSEAADKVPLYQLAPAALPLNTQVDAVVVLEASSHRRGKA